MRRSVALVGIEWDVVDLIESLGTLDLAGYFDLSPEHPFGNFPYFGPDENWLEQKGRMPELMAILALDTPHLRTRLYSHYGEESSVLTLISPHAHISKKATVGAGSLIQRGVTLMPLSTLGKCCKVNVNATVHHEAVIGNFCTLAPGCQILGNVVIEDQVYIGAGAIIRQRCRIGRGTVVGAGAVVVQDIPPNMTVVGVPAKEKCFTQ